MTPYIIWLQVIFVLFYPENSVAWSKLMRFSSVVMVQFWKLSSARYACTNEPLTLIVGDSVHGESVAVLTSLTLSLYSTHVRR